MRGKTLIFIFVILHIPGVINADNLSLEMTVNYFNPTNRAFKDIYGSGLQYGLELGIDVHERITVCIGGSYFKKIGELTFTKEKTILKIIPLEVGIQLKLLKTLVIPYIGSGISLNFFYETNPIGSAKDTSLGYWGRAGILLGFTKRFSLDLRINAGFCKVNPADTKVNIGGTSVSVGLKYKF